MKKIIVPVLLGPTAVGKTAYALDLAQKNSWEILSCDSRQIYRMMNIGTAKPDSEQLQRAVHLLIDVKNPDELYSAFEFAEDALKIIHERAVSGRTVLLCGGTGLYFKALSEGMSPGVETDPVLKEQLMNKGLELGTAIMHRELSAVDPEASKSIHFNDLQRIVRALAVFYQTGEPFSKFRMKGNPPENILFKTIKLSADRSTLYRKIDTRVRTMIDTGLVDECRTVLNLYKSSEPGLQTVGYRELVPFLSGEISLDTAIAEIQRNSRRYAKRQCTWFNHQIAGLDVESGSSLKCLEDYYKNFVSENI